MLWFLLIFVGTPLIELYFLLKVGTIIGALPTILLSIFTAALGGYLVREQGLSVLMRVRSMVDRGEVPAFEMLDGAILLLCGFSLLLPGFVTDALGFLLLIPALRHALIRRYLAVQPAAGDVEIRTSRREYIDADYRREDD
ncbi:FxsA family protein [Thiorhodovibrio frisius]|uniref:Protein affecting phage T7 exclusion by the F plasmid n=1 Tax=Thiorhodovibrio frisius TaxID=631362 RepID=H8YYH6_9GAMM|nr:FxsA family protein [Thiorhodovibrio frisius]EIC23502.1 protein affecting phage T7 exclusion by the F plasmid [Thiorhodovibrio frisius]WPL23411.1 Suppressor of F exclusion of phage T7 [Thiorhodovibrio frisius]